MAGQLLVNANVGKCGAFTENRFRGGTGFSWPAPRVQPMRRAGELLKQIEDGRQGQNLPTAKPDAAVPISRSAAAAEAGFSERQAKTAQRIATIPEDAFEDMVERGAGLSCHKAKAPRRAGRL